MKKVRRLLSLVLAVVLILTAVPVESVFADTKSGTPAISVESKSTILGETVEVDVTLQNNPGILGMTLEISYDEGLTLVGASSGDAFSALSMTKPGKFTSPCRFLWEGQELSSSDVKDGTILTLTFRVDEDAAVGSSMKISATPVDGDVYDSNYNAVQVSTTSGGISLLDFTPGDVNDDGKINVTDVVAMRRYIVGGYDITINTNAADVNADEKINSLDVIRLRRYIAGGYDVTLVPSPGLCSHSLTATAYKAPTCTEAGNAAYWYCSKCQKYFSDQYGNHEITLESTVISETGHTIVKDEGYAATTEKEGLTDGSHCSVCGEVIVAQEVIPALKKQEYQIVYNLNPSNDAYLSSVSIENPNLSTYTTEDGYKTADGSSQLLPASVDGYTFEGWFDGTGSGAAQVKTIAKGTTGTIYLYARWTEETYTITFDSPVSEVADKTYSTNKGATLPVPTLGGYTFLGWTVAVDEDRPVTVDDLEVISRIPKGTTGNITLEAHWSSKRNQTIPANDTTPDIVLDSDAGRVLFTYEIGTIENVPLYKLQDLACADGIITTKTETVTKAIEQSSAESIAETIANATTNSQSWTLSEDWNSYTSVSEEYASSHGRTVEEATQEATTSSNTRNLTSTSTESKNTTTSSGTTASIGVGQSNSTSSSSTASASHESGSEFKVDTKDKLESEVGSSISAEGFGVSASVNAKISASSEVDTSRSTTSKDSSSLSRTRSGTDSSSLNSSLTNSSSTVNSSSSSISSSSSYTVSNEVSQSKSVAEAETYVINQSTGYSTSMGKGGSNENNTATASTDSTSDEYASTFEYVTSEQVTSTVSYQTNGEKDGYYRLVKAGKIHVFAVVGYDIATKSYFVNTYSFLDDETYDFIDYSRTTASFNDEENGVLPFEVPIDIKDYVENLTRESEGLEVDIDTGMITGYTGNDTIVYIPDFVSRDSGNGTMQSVKITGISENAFKGNTDLNVIVFSSYITEIPDRAFEGCTNLQDILTVNVDTIGDEAFKGCTSLTGFKVPDTVTTLGENAFDGAGEIIVTAADETVAEHAVSSGAGKINLDISGLSADAFAGKTFTLPSGTEYFSLTGNRDQTYNNLKIVSDADETVLNTLNISSTTGTPLRISSEAITLSRCSVSSNGFAAILSGNAPVITLYGNSSMTSANGKSAVCRNITLQQKEAGTTTGLTLSGDLYLCGSVTGENYLAFESGDYHLLTAAQFAKYLLGSFEVTLDPGKGAFAEGTESVISAIVGDPLGTLPVPERTGYTFDGWTTSEGDKVDETTSFDSNDDITLTAVWKVNEYSLSWNDVTGCTIRVEKTGSDEGAFSSDEVITLDNNSKVSYGDTLRITYEAEEGFNLTAMGYDSITVTGDVTADDIYAAAQPNAYTASWTADANCTITVTRTGSQYACAATGTIGNGDTVYYGDTLSVSYAASTGHTIGSCGPQNITVTGNVTGDQIYVTTDTIAVTYNVVYRSSNGTNLGSTTVTKDYGTSNVISAPSKSGYNTPASQTVAWDSTSAKTITFTYSPTGVSTSQTMASADWFIWSSKYGIKYVAYAEYTNRTASSVQVRVRWVNTLQPYCYYGFGQYFTATINGSTCSQVTIATSSTWAGSATATSSSKSVTAYSSWVTVPVSTAATSVSVSATWKDQNSQSGSWSNRISIPAY